jgi:hypothetical protein
VHTWENPSTAVVVQNLDMHKQVQRLKWLPILQTTVKQDLHQVQTIHLWTWLHHTYANPSWVQTSWQGLLQEKLAVCPTTYWSYQINTEDRVQPSAIAVCSQDERESPSQSSLASKAEKSFNIHPPLYAQKDHTNWYVLLCQKTHLWSGYCWEHKPAEIFSIRIRLKFWYL